MDERSLLSNGVEALYEIRDKLSELENNKSKCAELDDLENESEKTLEIKKKLINDEVEATIRKRRDAISKTFDNQIDTTKNRIKKIKGKKEKQKDSKVSERIKSETAELQDENKGLQIEIKTLFKQERVPAACNSGIYYALFSPYTLKDLFLILATLLVVYLIIPCGIYYYLIPEKKTIYLGIIYFITILASGGLYFLIGSITKGRHQDAIRKGKDLKIQIRKNLKKINKIKKSIIKDKDESHYGLENFDSELEGLEKELIDIGEQKKSAIAEFEKDTRNIIEEEIRGRYKEEIQTLDQKYNQAREDSNIYENKVKELSMLIAKNYEAYLGSELLVNEKLDMLISLMESRELNTISEGILLFEQERKTGMVRQEI